MKYDYKRVSLTTIAGIKEGERLKAKGWDIVGNSPDTIEFRVRIAPIETLKKDEFFRIRGGKKVYLYKGYCRINKKYEGLDYNDIGNCKYVKKGTMVEIDFDF